jgi:hypothetical protein
MTGSLLAHGLFASMDGEIRRHPLAGNGRGIWDDLAAKLDPAEFRPQLAPDIEVREFKLRWGNDYAMIANPRDLLHYKLEPGEIELLRLMDGTRTVKEIVVERFRESGDMELSAVADLVRQLQVGNFLTTRFQDTEAAVRRAMVDVSAARLGAREFAKTQSIEWKDAHRLVDWLYRRVLRWFFIPWVVVVSTAAAIIGLALFWASIDRVATRSRGSLPPPSPCCCSR